MERVMFYLLPGVQVDRSIFWEILIDNIIIKYFCKEMPTVPLY